LNYLDPSEFEAYGLEDTTTTSWVTAASALINAHCRRSTLEVTQYTERMRLAGRGTARLTFLPLAVVSPAVSPLVSVRVRYGVPRRGEGASEMAVELAQAFGLPGAWSTLDVNSVDFDALSGELNVPQHVLGLAYNEVEVVYTAGLDVMPDQVKFACAQIVRNAQATPALNVRSNGLDHMHMDYFSDSLVDESVRKMLAPYVAQKVG
jgi:hypothetical protein